MKNIFAYDLECYVNFYSAVFINIEDENDVYEFCLYKDRNDIEALVQFVSQDNLRLVGFNSNGYDNLLLKAILSATKEITNRKLFNLSKQIISKKVHDYTPYLKKLYYDPTPFESVDLMSLVSINTIRPSLKHCGIHLKHDLIQDLPLDPEKPIKLSDISLMMKYNLNDVRITRNLYLELIPDIELREELGKQYNVDLLSASDSKIAKVVLDSAYGAPDVKATNRTELRVKDLLPSKLLFHDSYLKQFVNDLGKKKIYIGEHSTRINEKVEIGGITCTLAQGGIHSEDDPGMFNSDDEYVLIDSDVSSYYPAIIINEKVVPEHLDKDRFLNLYKSLTEQRLEAKKRGDDVTAQTLKISVNSSFGLMGFQFYWLYDMRCMYQVTITGQLYLLDLAEKLINSDTQLISMNTDGVLFKIKRSELDRYYSVSETWSQRTGFNLEHNEYKSYVRRDVNNYLAVPIDGKPKTKGIFTDGLLLNSKAKKRVFITSYNAPIIALGLQNYFKDSIDPEQTVNEESDIFNFMFSQTQDRKFKLVAEKIESGILKCETLQKTNRWIVSKNGYRLKKLHQRGGRDSALMKDCSVLIANNVTDVSLEDVDKQYYIDECWKVINEVEGTKNGQMSLF